ncbi:MAG: SsrA-binding protein SmpB [Pseudomonadota bacterium]
MAKKKSKKPSNTIVVNKKARHDFTLEREFEAGVVLEGWEVKSLRAGKVQFRDIYVHLKNGEAFLFGAVISPLLSASTHVHPEAQRSRKLLLHKHELSTLVGAVERKGYTIIALSLYWIKGRVKCKIALAKGKHLYDKRAAAKEHDWNREKSRLNKLR